MTDLKTLVRTEMARAGEPSFGMGDVADRRERKRRNQRIAAGVVGVAIFVVAIWVVTSGPFDQSQTPAGLGGSETGPTETGPPVAPDAEGIDGLPPEGATPSTPERGELVVELNNRVWVYADGRVISSVYVPALEPYSGLAEQHLTPEGVEYLRSNVLSTGLFEHDLDLVREDTMSCCLEIRVREGDRLVRVTLGPDRGLSDAQKATPEQVAALESLYELLTRPDSWPASVWTDQRIKAYVPTSYSFCSHWAELSRVLALLPEEAGDLLGAGYLNSEQQADCAPVTTEKARALAEILIAETAHGGWLLGFFLDTPAGSDIPIALNPVLPHGGSASLDGLPG